MLLAMVAASAFLLSGADIREAPRDVKLRLVEQINADRQAAGLDAVEFSEELSKAADAHCQEMLAEDYTSHWNRAGWKPYLRYAQAGIRDATSENIHSVWAAGVSKAACGIEFGMATAPLWPSGRRLTAIAGASWERGIHTLASAWLTTIATCG